MNKPALIAAVVAFLPAFAQIPPEIAAHSKTKDGPSELMVIQPSLRAKDLKGAYDFYIKNKIPGEIIYTLSSGEKLKGIIEVTDLPGGTMLIFKLNTAQGTNYSIVGVEDIESVTFS